MNAILLILFWILIPAVAIWAAIQWVTETREDRIRRWNKSGMSQMAIATKLGVTRYQVRKALA